MFCVDNFANFASATTNTFHCSTNIFHCSSGPTFELNDGQPNPSGGLTNFHSSDWHQTVADEHNINWINWLTWISGRRDLFNF
jgi:hypothetical protein